MRRVCVGVILVLLMVLGVGTVGSTPLATSAAFDGSIVAHVDNEVADLMWDPVPGAQSYKLYEQGHSGQTVVPEEIGAKKFHRVWASSIGADTEYRVCAVMADNSEDCSSWQIVHHEQVKGTLYKNRDWTSDQTFALDGDLEILDSVKLRIHSATVESQVNPSGSPIITVQEGGVLSVGAGPAVTIRSISIDFTGDASASDFQNAKLEDVQVDLHRPLKVSDCELTCDAIITIHPSFDGVNEVSNSTFENSQIQVVAGAEALISGNTLKDTDWLRAKALIELRGGAEATIEGNTILGLVDTAGSNATITSNEGGAVHVWPDTGGKVTIADNRGLRVSLEAAPLHNPPVTGFGPPNVIVDGNIMSGFGIRIGSDINAEVMNNTIVGGGYGIWDVSGGDLGRVLVHNNCIAAHAQFGVSGTVQLDASGNWWGSSDGPIHEDNRAGCGDWVLGEAKYEPFLTKDNCDPSVRNLIACWAEPIQTIQTDDNSVPLVAGKPAVVLAYVGSATGELGGVTGELIVRRGETLLGTVQAERSVSTVPYAFTCPLDEWNRHLVRLADDSALEFKVPAEWVTPGELVLTVDVNPGGTVAERDRLDNTTTMTATVVSQNPVSVFLVRLLTAPGDNRVQGTSGLGSLTEAAELWRKIYPGAQVELGLLPSMAWPYEMDGPSEYTLAGAKHGAMLLNRLGLAHMRLAAEGEAGVGPLDQIVGLFPEGTPLYQPRSDPAADGGRGVASFGTAHQEDLANALAPNLGYLCADTYGTPAYQFGYDVAADRFLPWAGFTDVFDYSRGERRDLDELWIYADDYLELLNYNTGATAAAQSAVSTGADQTYVLISGILSQHGEVEFAPAWQVTTEQAPLNPPEGEDYCVELRDGSGAVLESHCFDVAGWSPWRWQSFQAALPLTGSPARVVLRQGTTDLGSVDVSSSPPSVAIQTDRVSVAAGDAVSVSWSGSDGDGDELAYTILYSADDQASWLPVATNITATQYTLNLAEVPGGAKAWVGVEASDGFHTASDLYGPFAVGDHDPMVRIQSPEFMEAVSLNPTLSGYAYDMEDGELGGGDLVWTSDLSGELGTGQILFATGLTTGTHRLTLTATDSDGQSASDAVTIFVGEAADVPTIYLPLVVH